MDYTTEQPAPIVDPLQAFAASLTPKRAVSYLRVSTREQAERGGEREGFSIPAQREANKRKAGSLGAMVIKEFVDRGASARSANRPELQRMLEYIESNQVDFVIVHKLDRLARNRADDVEISQALAASKVRLVSTTESIDETPSGMLLHGIMSSIAEFYSRNLAHEVTKGLTQKAQTGGTTGRAPLGYRNIRTLSSEGREMRTVVLDEERAPLMRLAFELYATGDWSVQTLVDHLTDLGLNTVATPKVPSKALTDTYMHRLLSNPYYKGVVTFKGVQYQGRHEPLVDDIVWQQVQDVMVSHVQGERSREHPHYLKSTVYCGSCGERLIVSMSRSKTGVIYPYFLCAGRMGKRNSCRQKAVLIHEVENRVEDLYQAIALDPAFRASVENSLLAELRSNRADDEAEQAALKKESEKLQRQRGKLMEAHYAGAIPLELLKAEQDRIAVALARLAERQQVLATHLKTSEDSIRMAVTLSTNVARSYREAPHHLRKQFNQVFFHRILVNPDTSLRSELAEPFSGFLSPSGRAQTAGPGPAGSALPGIEESHQTGANRHHVRGHRPPTGLAGAQIAPEHGEITKEGTRGIEYAAGLNKNTLVELRGFEPLASSMRTKRATNCATAPCGGRA